MKKAKTELINPVQDMIQGNMPGLPQIIQNAMPVDTPRFNFNQSSIGLFFGNIKMKQLVKASDAEAKLAKNAKEMTLDKLDTIHGLVTFSARTADTLMQFEHSKTIRALDVQLKHLAIQKENAELRNLDLDAKEKEARIQQINYHTALIAQEVEAVKLDNKIKFKNVKDILGEEG